MDHLIEKTVGNGAPHTTQDGDIERLAHAAFKLESCHDGAGSKVDNLHSAPGIGMTLLQFFVELKP
jgi:hypothetical protein